MCGMLLWRCPALAFRLLSPCVHTLSPTHELDRAESKTKNKSNSRRGTCRVVTQSAAGGASGGR